MQTVNFPVRKKITDLSKITGTTIYVWADYDYSLYTIFTVNSFSVNGLQTIPTGLPATITLDLQYNNMTLPLTGTTGSLLQNPGAPAVRAGYTFGGWFKESACTNVWNFETDLITKTSMTLYAKWTAQEYTITYNLNGGKNSATNPTKYTAQNADLILNPATRNGYTFGGWFASANFSGAAISEIASGNSGDKEYWAKWTIIPYTITYNLNGGTNNVDNPQFYNVESGAIVLKNPTQPGKFFAGWKDNAALLMASVKSIPAGSTGNKTFWAKWSDTPYEINEYSITYNLNGGTNNAANPAKYATETDFPNAPIPLLSPTRKGATFVGWFDNAAMTGDPISLIQANSKGNKTFWAKWTFVPYTITYDLNGGSKPDKDNPLGYTVESPDIIFIHPKKEGWFFAGWYSTANFVDTTLMIGIPKGSSGNLELFAKWSDVFVELPNTLPAPSPIRDRQKSDSRFGIKFASGNVVSQRAEFTVILPDNDKVLEVKAVIYDNTGNVVFEKTERGAKLSWNLTNISGRNVANGSYLIVAEARGTKGTYAYSAKVGVKK